MHIVLENHYAHADFNPQVSGSNDTLFHGIKCDRIEYVYMVKYLGVHWFQILLLLGIHIHVLACTVNCYCSVWEYGLCNDIEISYRDGGGKNEVALNNFNVKLKYYDTIKFIML